MTRVLGEDVVLLQYVVLAWMCGWAVWSFIRIARGDTRTILMVQLIFFLFFAVPLALDLFVAPPLYPYQWGFIISQHDRTTNLLYLSYLAVVPVIMILFGGRPQPGAGQGPDDSLVLRPWTRAGAWAVLLSVPLLWVLAPDPWIYLRYAAVVGKTEGGPEIEYHVYLVISATLAIIAAVLLIAARDTRTIEKLLLSPLLAMALWIHGKRSAVALAMMLLLYLLWKRGTLRGLRFAAVALGAVVIVGTFSFLYQTGVREIPVQEEYRVGPGGSDLYVNFRIDYGRDAVTKQAIFAELNPRTITILDHRGQSFYFNLVFWIPRRLWPEKPFPYAVYVTAAMLRTHPRDLGWGVTTSILEEPIANFGWFGMLLGPMLPALVCRAGDRRRSPVLGLLTVINAALLMVLQLAAYLPLFLLWLLFLVRHGRQRRA